MEKTHSQKKRERSPSQDNKNKTNYKNKRKNKEDNNIFSSDSENSTENKNNNNNNPTKVKVREIWIGNLPQGTTKINLYKIFFIYGEISKIELNTEKNFAFIRYKLVNSASNAFKKTINNRDLFNGKRVRILYSDYNIRDGIIGDEKDFILTEKTCKLIYISLNKNSNLANDNLIKEIFGKFGKIKEISSRNVHGYRPSIYIEYSKYEEAQKAINEIMNDDNLESRKKLGDVNCDVNFYFQKKIYNNNNTKNNPLINNIYPPPPFMLGLLNNLLNLPLMYSPPYLGINQLTNKFNQNINEQNNINNININNNNINNPNNTFNNNNNFNNNNLNNTTLNINNFNNNNKDNNNNKGDNNNKDNNNNSNKNNNNNNNNNSNKKPEEKKLTKTEIKNILTDIIKVPEKKKENEKEDSSKKSEDEINFEKQYSLEGENLKNIWSGFLTKNKKDRISVDAYQIRGNISEDFNTEYNLDIHHKTIYEEILKRPSLGIVAFSPQDYSQCQGFNEYINYFNEKKRVGVINIKSKNKFILYLVPPCEFSRKFYQNPKKHLLGILVDSNVEPKINVDMNNLNLPPPVISYMERKLMMQKKKKTINLSFNYFYFFIIFFFFVLKSFYIFLG